MTSEERRRRLSKDERVLWSAFTKKVEPLRAPYVDGEDDGEPVAAAVPRLRAKAPPVVLRPKPEPARQEPDLVALGRREKQRVARGRDAIEGRLDLHGLTQAEAHGALLHFFHQARGRGAKLVLVITGKSGVLRQQVPQWLGLPEFRGVIVGFDTAGLRHGGEGALYVRLRRSRRTGDE